MAFATWGRLCSAGVAGLVAILLQGCYLHQHNCSTSVENCLKTGCCMDASMTCYKRDETWASCKSSCTPSPFGASCEKVSKVPSKGGKTSFKKMTSAPTAVKKPVAAHVDDFKWTEGTWTSGSWDCCRPSCSAAGTRNMEFPVKTCDAKTGKKADANEASVCEGGNAGTCANNQPFKVSKDLSMGFAAVAASSHHGLSGDKNCGQCFEILFDGRQHIDKSTGDILGGAHPDLVNRRMIVQVINVGYGFTANHSFDLLIPGAGQGIFDNGCITQYPNHTKDDFDCGDRNSGCNKEGCKALPKELQAGCEWRSDWYLWMKHGGRTNNPYIRFRRVQCPEKLVKISGASPDDDMMMPVYTKDLVLD